MHILGITISKKIWGTVLIALIALIIDKICQVIIKKKYEKRKKSGKNDNRRLATMQSLFANIFKYAIYIIAIILILRNLGISAAAITTSVGVFSLVIGLALQDILKDILTGISLLSETKFNVGDTIKIGDFKGTVVAMNLRSIRIQSYTGEIKTIFNRNILDITNYSVDRCLAVADIPVGSNVDVSKTEKVLKLAAASMNEEKLPSLIGEVEILGIQDLSAGNLVFRATCKCKPSKKDEIERIMKKEFKKTLDKNDIPVHN